MPSPLRTLADSVDRLFEAGALSLTETPQALTLAGLSAASAAEIVPAISSVGWAFEIVDSAGELADPKDLSDDFAPFVCAIRKPLTTDRLNVVSKVGFEEFLGQAREEETWHVVSLEVPFSSLTTNFQPWGGASIFSPSVATKSPRELVREYSSPRRAPTDIRTWLTATPASTAEWSESIFQIYARKAFPALIRALSNEILSDGSVVFSGPPRRVLSMPSNGSSISLTLDNFNELRAIASWVYESPVDAERRHGLFASEFGRSPTNARHAIPMFRRNAKNSLEGARLAYQLSLSDFSKDAIKAQGDLRKAIADDTAKLADNTRQVVTAVAAAAATCVALILTRTTATTPNWVLASIGVVAAVYLGCILASGYIFMKMQNKVRMEWRDRLYKFIPDDDYTAMVIEPASDAERMFLISFVAGIISALTILGVALAMLAPS